MAEPTESVYAVDLDWKTKKYTVVSVPIVSATSKTIMVGNRLAALNFKTRLIVGQDRVAHSPAAAVLIELDRIDEEDRIARDKLASLEGKRLQMIKLFEEVRGQTEEVQ